MGLLRSQRHLLALYCLVSFLVAPLLIGGATLAGPNSAFASLCLTTAQDISADDQQRSAAAICCIAQSCSTHAGLEPMHVVLVPTASALPMGNTVAGQPALPLGFADNRKSARAPPVVS